ncbi:helix-turn-helix domain-containing protein [Candidatus Kaiserbacteria bacterium]|nr:helix-turn-helix domain-containing protein [Candidatus Kaiserbacteria bacterium]
MSRSESLLESNEAELIQTLGLSEQEVGVYLAALELGQAHIQDISRKSGVKRTSIYNFIDSLKDRQLLSEVKKGRRKLYAAVSPHHLVDEQKSKVLSLERLIPQLLAIQNNAHNKPRVMFFEGIEGIKEIYGMTLRDKQIIYAWEDLDKALDVLPTNFLKSYTEERTAKKIPARCIDRDTPSAREWTVKNDVRLARETRFIVSEEFGTEINVFGGKVAFFRWDKKNPFGVVIEDSGIATAVRVSWQELWDRLPSASAA